MTKENSKILITAAGGKVGQHVVTQLAQKKVPARAGVSQPGQSVRASGDRGRRYGSRLRESREPCRRIQRH